MHIVSQPLLSAQAPETPSMSATPAIAPIHQVIKPTPATERKATDHEHKPPTKEYVGRSFKDKPHESGLTLDICV